MIIQAFAVAFTSENHLLGTACSTSLATANYFVGTALSATFRGQLANRAMISVEKGNARFKLNASAVATACGHILADGNYLILDDFNQMQGLRIFNEGATATTYVHITYFMG